MVKDKEKILLVNMPRGRGIEDQRFMPLGIGYIAAELRATGKYDVKCIDFQILDYTEKDVLAELEDTKYNIVGYCGFAPNYLRIRDLSKDIKSNNNRDIKIILGGPLSTHSYDVVLNKTEVDFCVLGEGETTILKLLENLDDPSSVINIAFKQEDGSIKINDGTRIAEKHIDDIEIPAYDLFDIPKYNLHRDKYAMSMVHREIRALDVLTGRGCPFSCKFCGKLVKQYRKRSIDSIIDELKHLITKYDINYFSITDELFIYHNNKWLEEFCLKTGALNIFWRCTTRARGLSLDHLKLMRGAGCLRMDLGIESGSSEMLKVMDKQTTPEDIKESVSYIREAGIHVGYNLLMGFPGENKKTVNDTVNLVKELNLPPKRLSIVIPYPGTSFFFEHINKGVIESHENLLEELSKPEEDSYHTLRHGIIANFTDMSDVELIKVKTEAEKRMEKNYDRYLMQSNFKSYLIMKIKQYVPFKSKLKLVLQYRLIAKVLERII